MRDLGPVLSPFNAFLLLQGLETLSLRMDRHVQSTLALAEFLRGHPGVEWVIYPGLADSPERERAGRYLPRGAGAVLTFGVKGGREAGRRLIEACELLSHLANVGDAKTLIIHPASTTHRRLDEEGLGNAGVTEDMVRISVGLETLDDIVWDLDRALRSAAG
jgi:O-acetylhomoserine (thiol)-lyase